MVSDVPLLGAVADKGGSSLGLSLLVASVILLVATVPLLLRSARLTDIKPRRARSPAVAKGSSSTWRPPAVREPEHWVDRLFSKGAEGEP